MFLRLLPVSAHKHHQAKGINMHNIRKISEDLIYIGANDRRISRFENQHPISNGMSYNSYLLLDEKTVLFDTADRYYLGFIYMPEWEIME